MKNAIPIDHTDVTCKIIDKIVRTECKRYVAVPTEDIYRECLKDVLSIFEDKSTNKD